MNFSLDTLFCLPFFGLAFLVEGMSWLFFMLAITAGDICQVIAPALPEPFQACVTEACYFWMDLCMFFIYLTMRTRKVVLWPVS